MMGRALAPLLAAALFVASACSEGADSADSQPEQGNALDPTLAPEQETSESFSAREMLSALEAVPATERRAAWQALPQAQRLSIIEHMNKQLSIDAAVSGMVNGEPFPAAWLVPGE
jgi:hypothetical protein